MGVLRALLVRLVWSGVITASLLPVVLLTMPVVRMDPRLGIGVTIGVFAVTFLLLLIQRFRRRT